MFVLPLVAQLLATMFSASNVDRDTIFSYSTIIPVQIDHSVTGLRFHYAKISGRVVDLNQTPIAGAFVSIDILAGGRVSSAWVATDSDGRFEHDSLLPGMRYVFEASRIGYQGAISKPIVASADTALAVEIVLRALSPNMSRQLRKEPQPHAPTLPPLGVAMPTPATAPRTGMRKPIVRSSPDRAMALSSL